jgi:hypothetical protein
LRDDAFDQRRPGFRGEFAGLRKVTPGVLAKDDELLDVNAVATCYATEGAEGAPNSIVRIASEVARFEGVPQYAFGAPDEARTWIGFF